VVEDVLSVGYFQSVLNKWDGKMVEWTFGKSFGFFISSYDEINDSIRIIWACDDDDDLALMVLIHDLNHEVLHSVLNNKISLEACKKMDKDFPFAHVEKEISPELFNSIIKKWHKKHGIIRNLDKEIKWNNED